MERQYYLTSEDFDFIYNLIKQQSGKNSVRALTHMLTAWEDYHGAIQINKKPLTIDSVEYLISNNFKKVPKIGLYSNALWTAIFYRGKNFIYKLHQYLKPRGFDLMEQLSKYLSVEDHSYKTSCLFPIYISYINKPKSDHIPESKNIFNSIQWLSKINKKYVCSAAISLLYYASKKPHIYNSQIVIDLFVNFTINQSSIPKNQIKRYESLMDVLEKNNAPYWNEQIEKTPKLQNRLLKKTSKTYEFEAYTVRKWTFDIHNLSEKNGNFNVKIMKDNFDRMHASVSQYILSHPEIYQFDYQNNDAIIIINLLVADSNEGRMQNDKFKKLIDVVYGSCLKSINLTPDEIKRIWDNILLAQNLENMLTTKEKNIQKTTKI